MSLVTVFAAESPVESCKGKVYYMTLNDGTVACSNGWGTDLAKIEDGESATIVMLKDYTETNAITFDKNITFDLNDHVFTINGSVTVKGANVTIKNGTINAANERILVDASQKETTLTIAKDVTVENSGSVTAPSVVKVTSATKATTVNINGTWEVGNEIVNCAQTPREVLTVNLNAKVTGTLSSGALLKLDAGNSVVNVNGGTYTSNKRVFTLVNGTLNINTGATLKATGDSAIVVEAANTETLPQVLNIAGGDITSTKRESVWFNGSKGTYKITDGTFTSGKDAKGKYLPALHINNPEFLEEHKGMITKGNFKGSIVNEVAVGTNEYKTAAEAAKILVGNATVSEKDGVVI